MFVESFKLRKNSWHMSLMTYIWGFRARDFSHICPYFWLSILNLIIIIPYFVLRIVFAKFLWGGLGWLIDGMSEYLTRVEERKFAELYSSVKVDPLAKEEALHLCTNEWYKFTQSFKYVDWDLYQEMEDRRRTVLILKVERKEAAEIKSYERTIKRKARITKLVNFIRPLLTLLAWALGAAVIGFVGWILYYVVLFFMHIHYHINLYAVLKWIGIVVGFILLIWAIIRVVGWLVLKMKCTIRPSWMRHLLKPFKWFFQGIGLLIKIIVQMIKNNCPAIDWEG